MDVGDGLSADIEDQGVHQSDAVLVAWLCRHLESRRGKRLVCIYML